MCANILIFIWKGNRLADWTDGPVSYEEHIQQFRLYSPTLQHTALGECVRPMFFIIYLDVMLYFSHIKRYFSRYISLI